LGLAARGGDRVPRHLRLDPRGERAARAHAPRRSDARHEHDVPPADLRGAARASALPRSAERAQPGWNWRHLHRRRHDGVDQAVEIAYFILLNALGHLCFVGSRMTTTLFALEFGASAFTVGALVALFAVLPMLLSVSAGRLIDRLGPRRPVMLGLRVMRLLLLAGGERALPRPAHAAREGHGGVREMLGLPALRHPLIASGLLNVRWDIYSFLVPLYGSRIGLARGTIGVVMSCFAV